MQLNRLLQTPLTPATLSNSFETLQHLKRSRDVMRALTNSLDSLITTFQSNMTRTTHHHGICSLPNELIVYIIELACLPDPESRRQFTLSLVCRRFRNVVLNHSRFWTYLTPTQPDEFNKLLIKRSNKHGLSIYLSDSRRSLPTTMWSTCYGKPGKCRCHSFLTIVLRHKSRWQDFTYAVRHENVKTAEKIQARLRGLYLPNLRHLEMFDNRKLVVAESRACYSWTTPELRSVQAWGIIPTLQNTDFVRDFRFFEKDADQWADVLCALQSNLTQKVTDLQLGFHNVSDIANGGFSPFKSQPPGWSICLPHVRSIHLRFFGYAYYSGVVWPSSSILQYLDLPNVEQISVSVPVSFCHGWERLRAYKVAVQWIKKCSLTQVKTVTINITINKEKGLNVESKLALMIMQELDKPWDEMEEYERWAGTRDERRSWKCKSYQGGVPDVHIVFRPFSAWQSIL